MGIIFATLPPHFSTSDNFMEKTKFTNGFHFDLGIPSLIPEWKKMFAKKDFFADLSAGLTVACIAIPLSLAIALASGVAPGIGLITAIIAGIICALFGGTTLAVSGPAAAMSVLLASIVEKFGLSGLIFMGLVAGLMQFCSGILGLGKLGKFVPLPVIAGFTAGIGAIILIGQIPAVLGLPAPDQSHIYSVFTHLQTYFHEIKPTTFALTIATIVIIRGLPKLLPKIPSALVAIIVVTAATKILSLHVPIIGEIPRSLPPPKWPVIPQFSVQDILENSFIIYLLASLETLLSSNAVDKLAKVTKHDADQELIGQGLGNIAVALFGGIPVTGVIVRSAANVQSGAKTRRSSIIHSLAILLTVFVIAPFISIIPIAALAGVLVSIALSMVNYKEFLYFWRISKSEAFIYASTFFVIIFVDLIAGVKIGILAAMAIVLLRVAKMHLHVSSVDSDDNIVRLSLGGDLTFLSISKIAEIEQQLQNVKSTQIIILDLSHVKNLDSTGATGIIDLVNASHNKNLNFFIKGLAEKFTELFTFCGGEDILKKYYLIAESDIKKHNGNFTINSYRDRLLSGVKLFYKKKNQRHEQLYKHIAQYQDPHTLFITCSDSRILTSLMTSTEPGELFIVRNVGNFIPPYPLGANCSEAAALEFSLSNLDITDIIICGHSNCGAMKACCYADLEAMTENVPALASWIKMIKGQVSSVELQDMNAVAKHNALNQINNLKTYPVVLDKIKQNKITIHAWFFNFEEYLVYEWNDERNEFVPIGEELKV